MHFFNNSNPVQIIIIIGTFMLVLISNINYSSLIDTGISIPEVDSIKYFGITLNI